MALAGIPTQTNIQSMMFISRGTEDFQETENMMSKFSDDGGNLQYSEYTVGLEFDLVLNIFLSLLINFKLIF
jgi:hypothetical protein